VVMLHSRITQLTITTLLAGILSSCAHDCSNYTESEVEFDEQVLINHNMGMVHIWKGNNDSALYYFDQGISLDPTAHVLYSSRARVYLDLDENDKAIDDMTYVTVLCPFLPEGYFHLGMLFDYLDQDDQAKNSYEEAIALYTDRIECSEELSKINGGKMDRALIYMFNGDEDKSIAEFEALKKEFAAEPMMVESIDHIMDVDKEQFLKDIFLVN
jgi:tetratricopeptide (TPR) repeat protein